MSITEDNLHRHELIGLKVTVIRSSNPLYVGIKGNIVDETKNMLIIDDDSKEKRLPKDNVVYVFTMPNGKLIELDGKRLVGRPADRTGRR